MIPMLLDALKAYLENIVKVFELPTAVQKNDVVQIFRAPEVHKMRLPNSSAIQKYVPYIIVQAVSGKYDQPTGMRSNSLINVRLICCTYSVDEEEGSIMLMNIIDAIILRLLKDGVIAKKYKIATDAGIEYVVYPEDTAPYYAGEIVFSVMLSPIEREVNLSAL